MNEKKWIQSLFYGLLQNRNSTGFGGIIFLKTHKTCSSTVTSILWRHLCRTRYSHCFLPTASNPGKLWDFNNPSDQVYAVNNFPIDENGNPMHYYKTWLHHAKSPSSRFRSAWNWYDHSRLLNISLCKYTNMKISPNYFDMIHSWYYDSVFFKYRTNLDATSDELLGLDKRHNRKLFHKKFLDLIESVASGKIYLLVCDRFDESMLLLNSFLQLNDSSVLLYLKKKVNGNFSSCEYISDDGRSMDVALASMQIYDNYLYALANHMLDQYIVLYGTERFRKELYEFKQSLSVVQNICRIYYSQPNSSDIIEAGLCSKDSNYCINGSFIKSDHLEFCTDLMKDNRDLIRDAWQTKYQ
eukprot:gene8367-11321_t